ncbi:MAG: DUF6144 family protein [candidate division Zixibacteria bacterium]
MSNDNQGNKGMPRSETRIKFAEEWVKQFFDILDNSLDEETRNKVIMAKGKACYRNWIKKSGQKIKRKTLEEYKTWVEENVTNDSVRIEGNTIYFQYMSAAETGLPSDEGQCLCPFVETLPEGLSDSYCLCSVGYVKEWHELLLGKEVEVELLESVLRGGKRCKFKITVL